MRKLFLPYFFDPLSNPYYYIIQNSVVFLEFVITRVHCTKDFLPQITRHLRPFVWMHPGRTLNNRIFRHHERPITSYIEIRLSFRYFFDKGRSVSIQTRNLQILATEILKDSKGIAQDVFANILSSMPPENFSSDCQPGFQMKPVKIGT